MDVLANDATFPSGQAINVTAITRNPSNGTSTIGADMSAVVYAPPSDFIGEVTFEYEACLEMELHVIKQMLPFQLNPRLLLLLSNDDTIPTGGSLIDGPASGTSVVSGDRLTILYTPPPSVMALLEKILSTRHAWMMELS